MKITSKNHLSVVEAVLSLVPDAMFSIDDTTIVWSGDNTKKKPSDAKIKVEMDRLLMLAKNNAYVKLRADAYPTITEQLDMQYWDSIHGTTTFRDAINAIKLKYPKGV